MNRVTLLTLADAAASRSGKYAVMVRKATARGEKRSARRRPDRGWTEMVSDAGDPLVRQVEVLGGRAVQVGDHNAQQNTFIGNYIERQVVAAPAAPMAGPVVAGDVPLPPAAFQPRPELLAVLDAGGPGVSVVRSVTGMRGVGKTQVAAQYARACIEAGWRLVAWVNAEDPAQMLGGLSVVAARLGIANPDADLEASGDAVRNRLEADGERCLLVFDNVADPGGLRRFLPAAGKARVVITSAGQAAAGLGRLVPVDVCSPRRRHWRSWPSAPAWQMRPRRSSWPVRWDSCRWRWRWRRQRR
jgi:hypothetical protein